MSSAFNQFTTSGNTIYIPTGVYTITGSGLWVGSGTQLSGGYYNSSDLMKIPDTDIAYELIEYPAQRYLPPIYTIKKNLESNLFDWIIIQYLKTQGRIREVD